MSGSTPFDVILDVAMGPLANNSEEEKPNSGFPTDNIPFVPKPPLSHFNLRKAILKRFFGSKKKASFTTGSVSFQVATVENTGNLYEALKKGLASITELRDKKKTMFSDSFLNPNNGEKEKEIKQILDTQDAPNFHDKEHLERFFNYLIQYVSEFSEEETLELQIRILKIIRNIKGKRDLKQHIRRYAAAINIKEPLFYN